MWTYVFWFMAVLAMVSFIKSLFVYRNSALRRFESRWGYAARWGVYRWLLAIVFMFCGAVADVIRSLVRRAEWNAVFYRVYAYLTDSRWIIDRQADESYSRRRS